MTLRSCLPLEASKNCPHSLAAVIKSRADLIFLGSTPNNSENILSILLSPIYLTALLQEASNPMLDT